MIWFTVLSVAGKSILVNALNTLLFENSKHTYLLDGDNVRRGLNKDLGFSGLDCVEKIRRIGEVGKLFVGASLIVQSVFISSFRSGRQMVRSLFSVGEFIEMHVSTSLQTCEQRDPKGLYKQARAGKIKNFTGIDSTYEPPLTPKICLDAGVMSAEEGAQLIYRYLCDHAYV
jgi:adenylylsulfate kinase